jgi:signal transduction histidine kinase
MDEGEKWKNRFERERRSRKEAEGILEQKSRELFETNEKLRGTLNSLEKRVLERTGELKSAMEEALKANKAKSAFLVSMSHEIRTPMNAVLGIRGLLRDTPVDENQQDLIKTGRESGEMLLSIINDILDFSTMEANKLDLESTSFDLHRLLNQSMALLKTRAQLNSLELNVILDDDLPRFMQGDSGRLQQILVNLINNACKFTPSGSITLHASATLLSDSRVELHCEIQDTGIGIPTASQDELFEEFSMVDQGHSRAYEGTGLGLPSANAWYHLWVVKSLFKASLVRVVVFTSM